MASSGGAALPFGKVVLLLLVCPKGERVPEVVQVLVTLLLGLLDILDAPSGARVGADHLGEALAKVVPPDDDGDERHSGLWYDEHAERSAVCLTLWKRPNTVAERETEPDSRCSRCS